MDTQTLINYYDVEILIDKLCHFPNVSVSFLKTLTFEQLRIIEDLEIACVDENIAAAKARIVLKNYSWPKGLSSEAMNYALFTKHYAEGCIGDTAFYYYIFDKCIPRRGRNKNKFFMDRLATFAKASFRELWEESQSWTINGQKVTLEPNKESSKKAALLPKSGEYAADHIIKYINEDGHCIIAEAEEKPCFSVSGAIETYKDPKTRYDANYLMLHLEGTNKFYIHNYRANKTSEMIPGEDFPGYPTALKCR